MFCDRGFYFYLSTSTRRDRQHSTTQFKTVTDLTSTRHYHTNKILIQYSCGQSRVKFCFYNIIYVIYVYKLYNNITFLSITKCCIHDHVNCKLQYSLAFLDWTGVLQCDQVPNKLTSCHILWKETIGIKKEHFRISVSFVLPLKSFCRNGLKRNYVQSNELSK